MSGASLHLADTPPALPPTTSNDYEFAAIKDKHCVGAAAAVGRECVGVCARHIQGALHRLLNFINIASSFARSIST